MSFSDFEIVERLGKGAYSKVYLVRRLKDGCEYALKKVKIARLQEKEIENALNEIRILASITHPNIVEYKEAFLEQAAQYLCVVMDYNDNGDLFQKIVHAKKTKTFFKEEEVWRIFIQIVKGLHKLHKMNILHRDLKSANVFLNKSGAVKLGDMNVSKVVRMEDMMLKTQTGTPYYASPEVWQERPYDFKSDIWSLGCVLYEMITLKPPFRGEDMQGLFQKVCRGHYKKISHNFSQDLHNLIRCLLQVNPEYRPNTEKILAMAQEHYAKVTDKMSTAPGKQEAFHTQQLLQDYPEEESVLMKTIEVPQELQSLSGMMPKANYSTNYKMLQIQPEQPVVVLEGIPPRIQSNTKLVNKMVLKSRNISCDHANSNAIEELDLNQIFQPKDTKLPSISKKPEQNVIKGRYVKASYQGPSESKRPHQVRSLIHDELSLVPSKNQRRMPPKAHHMLKNLPPLRIKEDEDRLNRNISMHGGVSSRAI